MHITSPALKLTVNNSGTSRRCLHNNKCHERHISAVFTNDLTTRIVHWNVGVKPHS